eukprot:1047054-Pelagomonas_calceolata.AAC.2
MASPCQQQRFAAPPVPSFLPSCAELGLEEAARDADDATLRANGALSTAAQQGQGADAAEQGPYAASAAVPRGQGPHAAAAEQRQRAQVMNGRPGATAVQMSPPEPCGPGSDSWQGVQGAACLSEAPAASGQQGETGAATVRPSVASHSISSSSQGQEGEAAQRQSPDNLQTRSRQSCPGSESSGSSGSSSSRSRGGPRRVLLRIVPEASMVQPGHKAACSMPVDMNSLQESIEGMARLTQQRR